LESQSQEKIPTQIHLNLPGAPLLENTLFLMAQSDTHRFHTDRDIERVIAAPIEHGKLLLAYDDQANPIGFSTHAFLSPEAEHGYLTRTRLLQPMDFAGEDGTLWCIDFAAPFGNCIHIMRVMRNWCNDRYGPGMKAKIYRSLRNHRGCLII
jgi:hemolysin-activating ACP:hemolysin acyltransferase|tara:strand:+ start:69 stop:524 length:456 start_codon:yes stop_codon:yes gene_type:complete